MLQLELRKVTRLDVLIKGEPPPPLIFKANIKIQNTFQIVAYKIITQKMKKKIQNGCRLPW